jgi:hypothetical protein
MLYLASENSLPVEKFEDCNPTFYVEKFKTLFNAMNITFNKKHIYYVGSDEGCSCGFKLEVDCKHQEDLVNEQKKSNQIALHNYLKKCLEFEETVELYGIYNGDEGQRVVSEREVSVNELLKDDFYFIEKELLIVHK